MRTERLKINCIINKDDNFVTKRAWLDSAYDWLASKAEPDNYTVRFFWNTSEDVKGYRITGGEFLAMFRQARTTDLPSCNCRWEGWAHQDISMHDLHCQRRQAAGL